MSASGYAVRALDAVQPGDGPGDGVWKPLRHHFGITAFGVNAWIARAAGDEIIAEHTETEEDVHGHEELYLVTRGSAAFTIAGDELVALPGTLVFVSDPELSRRAVARVPGSTIVSVGGPPGTIEPSSWETRRLR
jgi:hypothetical protein